MKWLAFVAMLLPLQVFAQSRVVLPSDLSITVSVDDGYEAPYTHEMVLITITGVYRRHITRENLVHPDLDGFSWAQLGPDTWSEERIDGKTVKVFTRRMAIYPVRSGELSIGSFTHHLTLTDEGDDWFEHDIRSEPITIKVAPAPVSEDAFWFPVRTLRVSDQWSNAPDQLAPGEGVLRVIRIEALGVTPEMIPPMPELRSPSAMIFAHPEKRLVELTPDGPITYAFWRWTIRPSNTTSGIVEPLQFSYFDTLNREMREVSISPQRIAYGTAAGSGAEKVEQSSGVPSVRLPGWPVALVSGLVFAACLAFGMRGHAYSGWSALYRFGALDPLTRDLNRCSRAGQTAELRRTASAILQRDGSPGWRVKLLKDFDRAYFDPQKPDPDLRAFVQAFIKPPSESA